MSVKIYTDGSCLGNPGAGGYAAIIIDETGNRVEITGGEKFTTNNRMELTAAIVALENISAGEFVEIFTDSNYLKNAFVQGWLINWKRRGWKTAAKTPVLNQDLWLKLDALISKRRVRFNWVKGHAGNKFNERCDELARAEAEAQKNPAPAEVVEQKPEKIVSTAEAVLENVQRLERNKFNELARVENPAPAEVVEQKPEKLPVQLTLF